MWSMHILTLLVAQMAKTLPVMRETWVRSLGWEDPLKKGKATHSSILAQRIQWTVYPWGHKEWDTTERFSLLLSLTPVNLPEEFHGQRSLEDYSPWDHKGSDMTEVLTYIFIFQCIFKYTKKNLRFLFVIKVESIETCLLILQMYIAIRKSADICNFLQNFA